MSRTSLVVSAAVLAVLTVVFADAVADLWPAVGVQADVCAQVQTMTGSDKAEYIEAIKKAYKIACESANTPVTRVNVEGMRMALSPDQALYAIAGLFAGLGGLVRSLSGLFFAFTGKGEGARSAAWALLRPFAAIALGLVVYVVARALFLPSGTLAATNPYGFLALAALTGLMIDPILTRLRTGYRGAPSQ